MSRRKIFSAEQIIVKLREAEVLLGQGKTVKEACRVLEISEQTYYRWRK
jgi:putative transposase